MPGLIRHLPQHKPWMVALIVIAVAVVMATCGLGSYLLVRDANTVVGTSPTVSPTVATRDISDRKTDSALLSAADVFPDPQVVVDPAFPPYKRVGDAQVAKDCRVAATGELGKLLVSLGCNQVVRATFTSADGAYLVTAGIFNLSDAAAATKAHTDIRVLVTDPSKGRFNGFVANSTVRALGRAPTQLAWDAQGHFLLYSVIARLDGKEISADDPQVRVIVYDIVEKYLRDRIIAEWSIDRSAPSSSSTAQ
jgi:hypothetical protein